MAFLLPTWLVTVALGKQNATLSTLRHLRRPLGGRRRGVLPAGLIR
jgi:hypothetical protein